MITRAKDGIVQPTIHPSLLLVDAEPKSVKQALQDSKWHSAITDGWLWVLSQKIGFDFNEPEVLK